MDQIAQELRRTFCTCAADMSAILIPGYGCTADRTDFRHMIRHSPLPTFVFHHRDDLRYDLSGLLHHNDIPDSNILFGDIILVVQSRVCHCCACQAYRLYNCFGSKDSGPSNLDHNVLDHRFLLLRRIFECRRPAWEFCRTS